MKQPLMIYSGITYDYCENIGFYKILGFLDEEKKMFTGIKLDEECHSSSCLETIKKALDSKDGVELVCGSVDKKLYYKALDLNGKYIESGNLNAKDDNRFSGQITVSQISKTEEPIFSVCSFESSIEDEKIRAFVSDILKSREEDIMWKQLQKRVEEKNSPCKNACLSKKMVRTNQ